MLDSREPPHHPKSAHAKKRVKIFNFGAILGRALTRIIKIVGCNNYRVSHLKIKKSNLKKERTLSSTKGRVSTARKDASVVPKRRLGKENKLNNTQWYQKDVSRKKTHAVRDDAALSTSCHAPIYHATDIDRRALRNIARHGTISRVRLARFRRY